MIFWNACKWKGYWWNGIQNTVNRWEDLSDQGKRGYSYVRVYIGAFGHAISHGRYTAVDTFMTGFPKSEFRSVNSEVTSIISPSEIAWSSPDRWSRVCDMEAAFEEEKL